MRPRGRTLANPADPTRMKPLSRHVSILGPVIAALFADRIDAKIGLLLIGALFEVVSVAEAFPIHRRRILNRWLLLGSIRHRRCVHRLPLKTFCTSAHGLCEV